MIAAVVVFFLVRWSPHFVESTKCNFEDTVDLTQAFRFPNSSYLYDNRIIIAAEQVATYDYVEAADGQRIAHKPHPRGCLCQERSCLRFCCHPTKELLGNSGYKCRPLNGALNYDPYINVIYRNGTTVRRNAIEDFTVLHEGLPCEHAYPLVAETDERNKWDMLENGMMMRHYDRALLSRRDYCLTPFQRTDDQRQLFLTPLNCAILNTASITTRLYYISDIISNLFVVLTVLVFLYIPELRNLRGKCIVCCLTSLAIGNTILTVISLAEVTLPKVMCSCIGSVAYFFYESAFLWLTIIGYDLWQTSKTLGAIYNDRRRFRKYSAYAWGIPLFLTAALMVIQGSDIPDAYKPGIGVEYCWLNVHIWSALLYFFGFNAIIFVCNIVFHCLTLCREMPVLKKDDELRKFVRAHTEMFGMFSLLLLIFITSYCLNLLAYFEEMFKLNTNNIVTSLSDCMDFFEGPLIFLVLVVRPNVLSFLKRRKSSMDSECESQCTQYSEDDSEK